MATVPGVPQIQYRVQASLSTLEFWWEAPINNGGALIQNYTLLCSSIPYSTVMGPSTFYAKVTPLINSQDYTFQLAASNSIGRGPYQAFTTAQPGLPPGGPRNFAVASVNETSGSATWNFSTNLNESGNHYFVISVYPSTPSISSFQIPLYPDQRSQLISNLSTTRYTFLLQSINDAGWSFPTLSTIATITPFYLSADHFLALTADNNDTGVNSQTVTNNSVIFTTVGGKQCARFGNSISSYLSLPFTPTSNSFTVAYWFYVIDVGQYNPWSLATTGTGGGSYALNPDVFSGNIGINIRLSGGYAVIPNFTFTPSSGSWQFVTFSLDTTANIAKAYLNGVFQQSTVTSGTLVGGNYILLGKDATNARGYNGYLRYFMFFNSVLSQAQITSLYNTTAAL